MFSSSTIWQDILRRLAALLHRQLGTELKFQFLLAGSILVAASTAVLVAEMSFRFSSMGRTLIVVLSLLLAVSLILWFVLRPLARFLGVLPSASNRHLAALVGDHFPAVRDRLLNLLQLHDEASRGTLYSSELIDASFEDLSKVIQPLQFSDCVDVSPVRRSWRWLISSLVVFLLLFIASPQGVVEATNRLMNFRQDFTPPPRFIFEVEPGTREVVKGADVDVAVRVTETLAGGGRPHDPLVLHCKPEGQVSFEQQEIHPDSSGLFRTTLANLRASTEYYAELLGVESERFQLIVVDRPMIRSLSVRLDFPSYTNLPPRALEDFIGDVTALAGTQVTVSGLASKSLVQGKLRFGTGRERALLVRGRGFSTRFTLSEQTTYRVELTDVENLSNPDPISYQLTIVPDESPTVAIVQPGRNLDIAGISSLPLLLKITDDFGFSRLRVAFRLIHSRYEASSPEYRYADIPLPSHTTLQQDVSFAWNLIPLTLAPEDVVEYFAEVLDNDVFRGPKSAKSQVYQLRLPSLEEVFTDLNKGHEETVEDLRKTADEAKDLKEKIESINQDLKKNKDLDWQQQKKLTETAAKYHELQKKLENVQRKLDDMIQQMHQQDVLSPETMDKYLELQQLFEQLNSADLQKAFQQMQQAMQNIAREQLQLAIQQLSFSEERFRESIERTINLLKRIQIEQKLDELKKRARELAQTQEDLRRQAQQAEDPKAREELVSKQEGLRKQLERLQEAGKDLQNRMEEFFTEMPERELDEANEQLQRDRLGEKMDRATQQLRQGEQRQATQLQQQIQESLQRFAEQLDALQMQMLQQQQQYVTNELRKVINNLLELSKREELLKEQSKNAPPNSAQLRQNAQDQMRLIQDLGNVINGLQELSQRSFAVTPEMGKAIGEALAKMQNAMRALDVRSGGMASQEQSAAMGALNKAAMQVQSALQALMQQGGGNGMGGLMAQLQALAQQQLSINMRTQSLEVAARLAAEQDAVRKSLDQLNKEAQTSGDRDRMLGDLEKISEEMREVVRDLEQNDVNPETMRKQERILSRLLDAARSTRERDFEKKRKAQTGTQVVRKSPNEIDPESLRNRSKLQEDLLKAMEHGYSKEYQELIRKYFEELQKEDN